MMTIKDEQFLDVRAVAAILGLTERAVRNLFRTGDIKARKVAGKYITTRDLLKAYIEAA